MLRRPGNARSSRWLNVVTAVLLVLASVGHAGAEPESAGVDPGSLVTQGLDVRQGTTQVAAPPSAARDEGGELLAPGDAPRITGALPRLAEPPASFNVYDGGWIRFAYPPSVRERVQPL